MVHPDEASVVLAKKTLVLSFSSSERNLKENLCAKVPYILKETSGTALYVYNITQQLDLRASSCNLCKKFLVRLREGKKTWYIMSQILDSCKRHHPNLFILIFKWTPVSVSAFKISAHDVQLTLHWTPHILILLWYDSESSSARGGASTSYSGCVCMCALSA